MRLKEIKPRARPTLTDREAEVLFLIAIGTSDIQIGRNLGIVLGTVRYHWHRIKAVLKAKNKPHAVALGMRYGIIDLDRFDPTANG